MLLSINFDIVLDHIKSKCVFGWDAIRDSWTKETPFWTYRGSHVGNVILSNKEWFNELTKKKQKAEWSRAEISWGCTVTNTDTIESRRDLLIMFIVSQSLLQNRDSTIKGQRLWINSSSNSSTALAIPNCPEEESTINQCTKIDELKTPFEKKMQKRGLVMFNLRI